jgi:hypothetical protein
VTAARHFRFSAERTAGDVADSAPPFGFDHSNNSLLGAKIPGGFIPRKNREVVFSGPPSETLV